MTIGIFDSGLGGLLIAKTLHEAMPEYDFHYVGDTLNLPYGKRSRQTIEALTEKAVMYLFEQGCELIIIACNTASAAALRTIQQKILPNSPYANRRVLGVVVPMLETARDSGAHNIGLLGTNYLIRSNMYAQELSKTAPHITLYSQATPLLVPLIEDGGQEWLPQVLHTYLKPLLDRNIDHLLLGCTHYGLLYDEIARILPKNVKILSSERIIYPKLTQYLQNNPGIDQKITKNGHFKAEITDLTPEYHDYFKATSLSAVNLKQALY